jgi:hypothetical protein
MKLFLQLINYLFIKSVILLLVLSFNYCSPPDFNNPSDPSSDSHLLARLLRIFISQNANGSESDNNNSPAPTASSSAPSALSYNPSSITLVVNLAMPSLSPTVTGTVVSYAVVPALPTGISLDVTTGVLSGTAIGSSASTAYTITASNAEGDTTTIINLDVRFNKRTFVTAVNLLPGTDFTSAATADTRCNSDANKPATGSYKAMIVDSTRRASLTANAGDGQLDWVFLPNVDYARSSGIVIGTTNAQSLLPFPLGASFTTGVSRYFTGLNTNWTTAATGNCSNWTDGITAIANSGITGDGSQNTTFAHRGGGTMACNGPQLLLCVEQ